MPRCLASILVSGHTRTLNNARFCVSKVHSRNQTAAAVEGDGDGPAGTWVGAAKKDLSGWFWDTIRFSI